MSKKYVIEIKPEYEDTTKGVMVLGARESNLYVDTLSIESLEELNSDYVNENFGGLQDDAYHRGLEEGKKATWGLVADASSAEYQRGLDDAWEAAKKIFGYEIDGGIPIDKIGRVFGYSEDATFCTADIIRRNTASEAIEKLKAYEEKQKADDQIKVRDEVVWKQDENVVIVVTFVYMVNDLEWCDGICRDGKVFSILTKNARKTGRQFDIDKILEEMKE